MPDDFNVVDATQEPVVEVQETTAEPAAAVESVNAEPAIQQTEQKAVQTPDENAKYAAARRKAEAEKAEAVQAARDEAAASLAKRFGIENVKTLDDFDKYAANLELQQAGIDPEKYKALRENDPEVKKAKAILEQQERASKDLQSFGNFRAAFKEANDREFDIATDKEVYQAVKAEADTSGKDMVDVFARYQNKKLLAELADLKAKAKAQETNAANAAASPGSVKADGDTTANGEYITPDQFEQNRSNPQWVRKNLEKIMKSRPKWGG